MSTLKLLLFIALLSVRLDNNKFYWPWFGFCHETLYFQLIFSSRVENLLDFELIHLAVILILYCRSGRNCFTSRFSSARREWSKAIYVLWVLARRRSIPYNRLLFINSVSLKLFVWFEIIHQQMFVHEKPERLTIHHATNLVASRLSLAGI